MKSAQEYDSRIGIVGGALEHLERIQSYGVNRVELVMLQSGQDAQVREFIRRNGWTVGLHCPLYRDTPYPEYPLLAALFDTDPDRQALALTLMENEIRRAADWDAVYVVLHLQRSVGVLHEPVPEGWDQARAVDAAARAGERLARVAERTGVPIHIENMMSQPLLSRPEAYLALLDRLPSQHVRLCFDVGHAALDAVYYGFDVVDFAAAVAPRVGSLHIHNNQILEDFDFAMLREKGLQRKYPVHPSQEVEDSWIDIEGILRAIFAVNPSALPTLEVYYALDTDPDQFREGLRWLEDICFRAEAE